MQFCFSLARLSKNYVNKTSIFLSKRANSSLVETFTRSGFVDQVYAIHLQLNLEARQVPVVHSDSLAPVRALLTKLEGEHGGRLPGQLSRWKSWGDNIALNIFSQHLLYPELASLALSPALLNTVSSLLGPDLVLLATTLFAKYPSSSELGERYTIANLKVKLTKRGAAKLTFRKQDQLKLGPENSPLPRKRPWAQLLRPKPCG